MMRPVFMRFEETNKRHGNASIETVQKLLQVLDGSTSSSL